MKVKVMGIGKLIILLFRGLLIVAVGFSVLSWICALILSGRISRWEEEQEIRRWLEEQETRQQKEQEEDEQGVEKKENDKSAL